MPKRTDIKKILIIGSGPIVIGQACEFDYSGTQALNALKREGYKVVLVNSNPATIMTDPEFADATYVEPLTPKILEAVIAKERPDVLLPTLGGQTALNLACELAGLGILKKYNVELIGAKLESIKKAEDRLLFKKTMQSIGLEVPESGYASTITEAETIANEIGFPIIIRPSFTLGGTGSAIVYSKDEFLPRARMGLDVSPVHQILLEESLIGWKEFEFEVMRDSYDNCVVVCSIENLDPMGVHTGDSITVAPAQTLTDKEYQNMRDASFACMRAVGVDTGGSNVQFAVDPKTGRMVIIEMNPRVSRSSALASKATGFPIAKMAALLAVGYRLDEIPNDITKKTPASFEPSIDYVVVKVPRFAFEKFTGADQTLGTSMKSVGEVMALGRTFNEALQKALRGLETGRSGLDNIRSPEELKRLSQEVERSRPLGQNHETMDELVSQVRTPGTERIFHVKDALQAGLTIEEVSRISSIDPWFVRQIAKITDMEKKLKSELNINGKLHNGLLKEAKREGFSDVRLAEIAGSSEIQIRKIRKKAGIIPVYKLVDTCAAEFEAYTPYYYSTYEEEDESDVTNKKKVMILGGGPNRIGQGIEFDYCCVHAAMAIKEEGYETIMVNCNPETVSTDYDTSDRLYFEPVTLEDILNIVEKEKPYGVIVQFGGQTPLNIALPLHRAGVKILGTSPDSIDTGEDRIRLGKLLDKLKIPKPAHGSAASLEEARIQAKRIGYPVMVRPSYVLGGRAMEVAYDEGMLSRYVKTASTVSPGRPVFIDKFLENALEIDVDVVSDGRDVYIGGIMEHIEEAGIHSGDSACVIPPRTLTSEQIETINKYTQTIAKALKVKGLMNLQLALKDNIIYLLEVNPRASRTVPFVSKATGIPLAKAAAKIMLGRSIKEVFYKSGLVLKKPKVQWFAVKEAVLPWSRFPGVDMVLGPEMRSTGEVMGIAPDFAWAFAKSQDAAGSPLPENGAVLFSLRDSDKIYAPSLASEFSNLGFEILATQNTAKAIESAKIPVRRVNKLSEGRPNVVDVVINHQVALIINTPSGKKASSDGYAIRKASLAANVPLLTTVAAAKAALEGISQVKNSNLTVNSLQEYYKSKVA